MPISETEIRQPDNFLNIWHLTRQQQIVLTEAVEKTKGQIYVFVHPFYICEGISWDDEEPPEYKIDAKPKQQNSFVQIIRDANRPIIMFEQSGWPLERTQQILANGGIFKSIYLIPTVPEDPQPSIIVDHLRSLIESFPENAKPFELLEDNRITELSWDLTSAKLDSFGIKQIMLTGRTYPEGCVGIAEKHLKRRFSVQVMPETYLQNFLDKNQ